MRLGLRGYAEEEHNHTSEDEQDDGSMIFHCTQRYVY